jgi:hypothetical protein
VFDQNDEIEIEMEMESDCRNIFVSEDHCAPIVDFSSNRFQSRPETKTEMDKNSYNDNGICKEDDLFSFSLILCDILVDCDVISHSLL